MTERPNKVLDIANLDNLNAVTIRFQPNRANIQQVEFTLNGETTVDDSAPFEIPLPPVGEYTISALPIAQQDGVEVIGEAFDVSLTIVDRDASRP
jgi:hypothetical protein